MAPPRRAPPGRRPGRPRSPRRHSRSASRERALEHPDLGERRRGPAPARGSARRAAARRPVDGRRSSPPGRRRLAGSGRAARGGAPSATRSARSSRRAIADSANAAARVGRPSAKAASPARAEQAGRAVGAVDPPCRYRPVVELEGELEVGEGIARRIDRLGERRGLDGGDPRRPRLVGDQVVAGPRSGAMTEAGRQRRVVPPPLGRQEVGLDRLGDELVPEADRGLGRQRGGGARRQRDLVGVAVARDVSRTCRSRARNPCSTASTRPTARSGSRIPPPRRGAPLDRGAGRSALRSNAAEVAARSSIRDRLAGRRDEAQDPPALRRPLGEPGDDELVERPGQRGAGELAPRRQELLGDERIAARPLGDEEQDRGRRALALDRLDELGELVAVERLERELGGRRGAVGHRGERRPERMSAGQLVGLVGRQDEQAPRPGHPGEERRRARGSRRRPTGGPRASARSASARRSGRGARGSTRASASGAAPAR